MENKYPLIEKYITTEHTISEPIVIDIRTTQEIKKCTKLSMVENLKHIPYSDIPFHLPELLKYKNISVICRSGNRSQKIVNLLKDCENRQAKNVAGGFLCIDEVKNHLT